MRPACLSLQLLCYQHSSTHSELCASIIINQLHLFVTHHCVQAVVLSQLQLLRLLAVACWTCSGRCTAPTTLPATQLDAHSCWQIWRGSSLHKQ